MLFQDFRALLFLCEQLGASHMEMRLEGPAKPLVAFPRFEDYEGNEGELGGERDGLEALELFWR